MWARKHADVIFRFGRFPHRNAILGRASTPEEEAFLREPGSRVLGLSAFNRRETFKGDRPWQTFEITLALLLVVALVGVLARFVVVPVTLLLVGGGVHPLLRAGLSELHIEPDIFFALFIPPLLFADGWRIPKRDLLSALRPVMALAFGLVFLTVVASATSCIG